MSTATPPGRGDRRGHPALFGYPRSSLVVPAAAAFGGLVFAVWKPGIVRSAFGSPRSVAFTLVIVGLVVGLGALLPRFGLNPLFTGAVQAVPLLFAFVVTVLPAFDNVTVDESLPTDVAAGLSAQPGGPQPGGPQLGGPQPGGTQSPDARLPAGAGGSAPGPQVTAAQPAAVEIGRAELVGIDHDATGTALLIRLLDGSHIVRFENLDVEPGPDYHVHLVPGAGRTDPDGGRRLDALKGNRGSQNYPVGADVAVDTPTTVLIWCRAFAVPIATATLGA